MQQPMMLQNKLYSDAKFGAIEAQLASISCKMAKQPEIYATSAVCPNAAVVNGLGIVVPLDKSLPENELELVIERSEVEAIFFSSTSIFCPLPLHIIIIIAFCI